MGRVVSETPGFPMTYARLRPVLALLGPLTLVGALVGASAGCDPPVTADAGVDASVDAPPMMIDVGPPCTNDEECNDGVPCTLDSCDSVRAFCRHVLDNASCDDGVFCNGDEMCDAIRGCRSGPRRSCDDGDVCTVDACNETDRTCDRRPRDLDRDGDVDFFCTGGGDCDDRDNTRSSTAPEICADTIDNDCDDLIDEPECGTPPHDSCDDPLDVSAGGTFVFETRGTLPDYGLACAFDNRGDVVAQLTIPAGGGPRDVRIRAEGESFSAALSLRSTCIDGGSEIECADGWPAILRARALPEGTYYIVAAAVFGVGELVMNVEISDPTPPALNDQCPGAIDVGTGGTFTGSFVDTVDDTSTTCGFFGSPDVYYALTLTATSDVRINAGSITGEGMAWSIRSDCAMASSDLRCGYGAPAAGTLHQLDPGTYYIVLEGPTFAEVDYTLTVDVLPATPPALGDTCAAPIPLTPGVRYSGSLAPMEHDYEVSCGYHYREAVHVLTLGTAADVTIDVNGGTAYMNVAVRPDCDSEAGQLRCDQGSPARARVRGLPIGTYYIIVESSTAGAYTLDVALSSPTTPIAVTGNDNCTTAVVVPETGGVYTGNTFTALPDYETTSASCGFMARSKDVVFRLDLTTRRRVIANTDGSGFDTVLYYIVGSCPGPEAACDDNGGEGTRSLLDRTLEPGTYYFVVDGWGTDSSGPYVFEIATLPP
jgi:Putative metal-binding motif